MIKAKKKRVKKRIKVLPNAQKVGRFSPSFPTGAANANAAYRKKRKDTKEAAATTAATEEAGGKKTKGKGKGADNRRVDLIFCCS